MNNTPADPARPIWSVIASPSYRYLGGAGVMVNIGMWGWLLTSSYLVYQLTRSPFLTQLNGVAFTAPNLFFGIFSGVLADSFERRRLLQASYVLNGVVALILAWLALTSRIEVWHVVTATLAIGSVNTLDWSARWTLASTVVERRVIPSAMALESASLTGGQFAGPWLAGALVEFAPAGQAGVTVPIIVIAALFLAASLLMLRVAPLVPQEPIAFTMGTAWSRTIEGIRIVAGNRVVIGTLGVVALVNVFFHSYTTLVPTFAQDVLHVNPALMGLLGGAHGIGSLAGATFIATRKNIRSNSAYFITGSLMTLAGLMVFSVSRSYPLSVGSLIFAGLGLGGFSSMLTTLTMLAVTDEMRGRASGIINGASRRWPRGNFYLCYWFRSHRALGVAL
jgi:MFS family permease